MDVFICNLNCVTAFLLSVIHSSSAQVHIGTHCKQIPEIITFLRFRCITCRCISKPKIINLKIINYKIDWFLFCFIDEVSAVL